MNNKPQKSFFSKLIHIYKSKKEKVRGDHVIIAVLIPSFISNKLLSYEELSIIIDGIYKIYLYSKNREDKEVMEIFKDTIRELSKLRRRRKNENK